MMIYDRPTEYVNIVLPHKNIHENDIMFVAYIDENEELDTMPVKVKSMKAELNPFYGNNSAKKYCRPIVSVLLGEVGYAGIIDRVMGKKSYRFKKQYDFGIDFVKPNEFEAKLWFLTVMYESQVKKQRDVFNERYNGVLKTEYLGKNDFKTNAWHQLQKDLFEQYRQNAQKNKECSLSVC